MISEVTPVWKAALDRTCAWLYGQHSDIPQLLLAGVNQSPSTTETALRCAGERLACEELRSTDQVGSCVGSGCHGRNSWLNAATVKGSRPGALGARIPRTCAWWKLLHSCLPESWFCSSCFQPPGPKEQGGGQESCWAKWQPTSIQRCNSESACGLFAKVFFSL